MSHVDEATLHALVDDELDAAERSAVEAHLAACGDCARRFAEATAMARQVVTLLGALDAPAAPVRVVTPTVAAHAPTAAHTPVLPLRQRMVTLRRVAMAASVLLVAGVSYQVGRSKESEPSALERPVSANLPVSAAPIQAAPSVVDAARESMEAAAVASSMRAAPRGPAGAGTRAESKRVAADRASDGATASALGAPAAEDAPKLAAPVVARPPAVAQRSIAPAAQPMLQESREQSRRLSRAVVSGVAATGAAIAVAETADAAAPAKAAPASAKPIALAGYRSIEQESVPSITRRQYVSASGTALELSIMQLVATSAKQNVASGAAPEFVVTTANGRSVVRWQAGGMEYMLQGPLPPDSLIKLATQLRR